LKLVDGSSSFTPRTPMQLLVLPRYLSTFHTTVHPAPCDPKPPRYALWARAETSSASPMAQVQSLVAGA